MHGAGKEADAAGGNARDDVPDTGGDVILSADDHIDLRALLPSLLERYLPARYRQDGPRVRETAQGPVWVVGDEAIAAHTGGRVIASAITRAGLADDGMRTVIPERRLAVMDADGLRTSVIYGAPGLPIRDAALRGACIAAYNDWARDFNAASPERLCVLANLPSHAVDAAVAELKRVAMAGHRGVIFSVFEAGVPVHDPAWDALWAAAAEAGMPVSFHIGGGTKSIDLVRGSWRYGAFTAVAPMQLDEPLAGMLFSGALERHPGLRLVLAESGLGWLPYLLERMDMEHRVHGPKATDYCLRGEPSAIFRRQVFATFEDDPVGVAMIPRIGADNVMWASDYPHQDSTFPHSRKAIGEMFRGAEESLRRKVVGETAARLYGFSAATG